MKPKYALSAEEAALGYLKMGAKRIYILHEPNEEVEAREFAKQLANYGLEPVVAADVRPNKQYPRNEADVEVVNKVIGSCDAVLCYNIDPVKYLKEKSEK